MSVGASWRMEFVFIYKKECVVTHEGEITIGKCTDVF